MKSNKLISSPLINAVNEVKISQEYRKSSRTDCSRCFGGSCLSSGLLRDRGVLSKPEGYGYVVLAFLRKTLRRDSETLGSCALNSASPTLNTFTHSINQLLSVGCICWICFLKYVIRLFIFNFLIVYYIEMPLENFF